MLIQKNVGRKLYLFLLVLYDYKDFFRLVLSLAIVRLFWSVLPSLWLYWLNCFKLVSASVQSYVQTLSQVCVVTHKCRICFGLYCCVQTNCIFFCCYSQSCRLYLFCYEQMYNLETFFYSVNQCFTTKIGSYFNS